MNRSAETYGWETSFKASFPADYQSGKPDVRVQLCVLEKQTLSPGDAGIDGRTYRGPLVEAGPLVVLWTQKIGTENDHVILLPSSFLEQIKRIRV